MHVGEFLLNFKCKGNEQCLCSFIPYRPPSRRGSVDHPGESASGGYVLQRLSKESVQTEEDDSIRETSTFK